MPVYKHILLTTDLDDTSHVTIEKTRELLNALEDARVTLIHTIEPTPAYGYPGSLLESPIIDQAKQEMARLGESLHIPATDQRIEFGSIKTEILKVAKELKVDLIVVGNHGRHGLARLLLDSSANSISHDAQCDVLTVQTNHNHKNRH